MDDITWVTLLSKINVAVFLYMILTAMLFPISLIAFEKMRKKVMFWKRDTVSIYCIFISLRTNIHNDSCRV